jgi:dienelactone hydrolase
VNPRITVCFSGPVNVATLSTGIGLLAVGRFAPPISINQVIFDPVGLCAYAKPNQVLDQDTEYLLVVSSKVLDANGNAVKASKDFGDCLTKRKSTYCQTLSQVVNPFGIPLTNFDGVVAASLFTTLSATKWLQQVRANINSNAIPGAGTLYASVSTFTLADVTSIIWMPQTGVAGVNYNQPLPLNVLPGVDRISFGLYLSPLYLNTSGPLAGAITTTPTNTAIPAPSAVIPVSFHVFLPPAGSTGEGKIPVIIYGHGLGDDQFGAPTFAASTWAQEGFATLAIEITGHGYGPLSTTQVTTNSGTVTVATPGRGIQFSPAEPIGPADGCILPTAIATRDCSRQTAVDLFALVRAIRDTQGLGLNLDPSRIYYVGQSFGSFYGTLFEAVEPDVSAGTLNVGGGTQADVARLSPIARELGAAYLATFTPPLLNVPPAPPQAYFHDIFNDEYVYRGQTITDNVPGALAIQAAFEQADWLGMLGDPLSYAAHLSTAALPGVPRKSILVQFGLGDLEVPNPTESALVRAGGLQAATWMLRTDLAAALDPALLGLMQTGVPYPIYPHRFLSNPTLFDPASPPLETAIGVAAQKQIADFFASGGVITNPNQYFTGSFSGLNLFQIPDPLPEGLNFLQIQP